MKTNVTIDEILAYNPCSEYSREYLETLFAGRSSVDAAYILAAPISDAHKLDCLLRSGLISEPMQTELKRVFVNRIDIRRAAAIWRDAAGGSCADAAFFSQRYAARNCDGAEERETARAGESAWQLAQIRELI